MASERISIPSSIPGASWVEILSAYTFGVRRKVAKRAIELAGPAGTGGDPFAYRLALVETVIVSWSEPEPPTAEALEEKSPDLVDFIAKEFETLAVGRNEEEYKNLDSPSSDGQEPVTANSHRPLATSMKSSD